MPVADDGVATLPAPVRPPRVAPGLWSPWGTPPRMPTPIDTDVGRVMTAVHLRPLALPERA